MMVVVMVVVVVEVVVLSLHSLIEVVVRNGNAIGDTTAALGVRALCKSISLHGCPGD